MERKGFELYNAAKNKEVSSSTLRSLLEKVTWERNTVLHLAVNFENKVIAEKILESDQRLLYKTNNKGDTALHIAARFGYMEMVELLIKYRKQDVEQGMNLLRKQNSEEDTALHVAVRKGEKKNVKLLIDEDPTLALMTNKAEESPLFLAVDREFYDIALEILKLEKCSPEGRKNMNALHAAVIRTYKYKEGMSALHISANKGHVDVMDTLIKRCPDICELLDNKGRTALHYAVESGMPKTVKFLLRKEEFQNLINEQDEEGNTPLHLAATRGYAMIVQSLSLFSKVDNVIKNKADRTTLDILRSKTQKNILFWLADEMPLGPFIPFFRYNIGYLPSLETVATRETKEAHSIETATNGEGHHDQNKVSKKELNVEGNNNEEKKTEAPCQKAQDNHPVQKEESSQILASTSLMVATIVATVAFQAACQDPGGYDDKSAFLMCFQFIVAILPRYFQIPYPRLFIFMLSELSLLCMIVAFLSVLNTQNSKPSDSSATDWGSRVSTLENIQSQINPSQKGSDDIMSA
ncbi:ankyrin repeat-containing protein At5g02620-like [Quercus lobata]|uniref:ankyrin repeat-containing protein At5g02620-like n=1 Tax=Quercus lobata TaxID=97700 RepID=UPI0012487C0A|nr:ankyrin repeat-containing protein At5g02620-like [Quercus lobata]